MGMFLDLRGFLEEWPYDTEGDARIRRCPDGREIILVRQPMGLEQYETEGRPDGRRVQGMESLFDFHQARLTAAQQIQSDGGFDLSTEECAELFHEGALYHHRLLVLFRLKDWPRAERDARRNLHLIDFVKRHARCAEDRVQLDQWQPAFARIAAVARAMIHLDKRQSREALKIAREVIGIMDDAADDPPDPAKLAEILDEIVRDSLSDRPALRSHEEAHFLHQDDFWTIRYQGHTAFLKTLRGFHCLAILLRSPGREFHVSELLATPPTPERSGRRALRDDGTQLVVAGMHDTGPILDTQAKTECKRRLRELQHELEEAERFGDPLRAAKAQEEMGEIVRHLASALGLGGRDRKTSSDAERARCAVTKRVKESIHKIAEAIPALGHHLTARIRTGYFCSYNPHPDRPVAWKL